MRSNAVRQARAIAIAVTAHENRMLRYRAALCFAVALGMAVAFSLTL